MAPEAPSGRFDGRTLAGHDWFRSDGEVIEPSSFGISLSLLDGFVAEHAAGPMFLVGQGDGGCLALALLVLAPGLVGGVAAIGGRLPDLVAWGLEPQPLGGRPVLLIGDGAAAEPVRRMGARLTMSRSAPAEALADWLPGLLNERPADAG